MVRLKQLRKHAEMTQQELADFLGITRGAYSNIENGKREPDFETLNKIADYFHVSTDYLLGRSPAPSPEQQKTSPPFGELVHNLIEDDPEMEQIYNILIHLSSDDLKKAKSYLDYLRSNQENKDNP